MRSSFVVERHCLAEPATVFAIVADGERWSQWAGPVVPRSAWERTGLPAPGGVGAVRRLGIGPLSAREEIVAYDAPHRLAYVLRTGERLHHYRAQVDLAADPAGGTRIVWSGELDTRIPLLRRAFPIVVSGLARRLGRYAERGLSPLGTTPSGTAG